MITGLLYLLGHGLRSTRTDVTAADRCRSRDSRQSPASLRPTIAALVTVIVWASGFVGIRSGREALGAGPLALLRLTVASVALSLLLALRREGLPARRALPGIIVCGVLWFGVYNITLNEAEGRVDAGTAAMLVSVAPILIAALAGLLLKEGFPARLLVGSTVAFSGTVLIGFASSQGARINWYAVLCLVSAVVYATAVVVQKPTLQRATPLQITWLACLTGTLVCVPFAPALVRDFGTAPATGIGWAVYLGLVPTGIGFVTWAYALAHMRAGRLAVVTYLSAPLTVLLSWIVLGQVPAIVALAGGGLCLCGVAISRAGPTDRLALKGRWSARQSGVRKSRRGG